MTITRRITAERVRELFDYEADTGLFRHRTDCNSQVEVGEVAGGKDSEEGYWRLRVDGLTVLAHRVAWLWVTGEWPDDRIDHKNGVRHDNRFSNLRACSALENARNVKVRANSSTGVAGVTWESKYCRWKAHIKVSGKCITLGRFKALLDAVSARRGAEIRLFGDFSAAMSR
ncbi:HNH endonuclease [Variovorax paradoxus]|nr:HNH endonuclease [Variovorax paradoxus]